MGLQRSTEVSLWSRNATTVEVQLVSNPKTMLAFFFALQNCLTASRRRLRPFGAIDSRPILIKLLRSVNHSQPQFEHPWRTLAQAPPLACR